ncbi:hypothetical protein ACFE04_005099 [Oxalis oulophora]
MEAESMKWVIMVGATWLQALTGTNFDFSSYSSTLKSVLGISQLQLNYLSTASDLGKAFGWCSGLCLMYFPLCSVMFFSAFIGFFAYGLQFLVIQQFISLPYFMVFFLCLLAGCSICWFNTVSYMLCIRNFTTNRPIALSLTVSFNGLSAALYTLIANAINHDSATVYLSLNALLPLFISSLLLIPILRQPPLQNISIDAIRWDYFIFIVLNVLAVVTGLYLLLLNSLSSTTSAARILLAGAIVLLILPLCLPGILYAREWARQNVYKILHIDGSSFSALETDDLDLQKELNGIKHCSGRDKNGFFSKVTEKDRLTILGEEHSVWLLVRRWDFWLYYVAYFCGGTIGLVYSNNLGQIAESLGFYSQLSSIITLYSSCSFFGRLLAAAPDFLPDKVSLARTGWFALALVPTPIAFFLLVASPSEAALRAGTAMIGLSSGFVISTAVSITSELFGANNVGVNHNILITNIPIGSLLFGLLAAVVYDNNAPSNVTEESLLRESTVCMAMLRARKFNICDHLASAITDPTF